MVTTTARESFSRAESAALAFLIFKRFGRDLALVAFKWRAILVNSCDDTQFLTLVVEGENQKAARGEGEAAAFNAKVEAHAQVAIELDAELEFPEVMREYRAVREARKVAERTFVESMRASKPTTCRGCHADVTNDVEACHVCGEPRTP